MSNMQMSGFVPPEVLTACRERRQELIDALKEARLDDVTRLSKQHLAFIEDVNYKASGQAILYRNVISSDPAALLPAFRKISNSPITQDSLIALQTLVGILDASARLKGCPVKVRAEVISLWLTAAIKGEKSWTRATLALNSSSRHFPALAMTLLRNPGVCEAVIANRSDQRDQDRTDLQVLVEKGTVDSFCGESTTITVVMIAAALGVQLKLPARLILSFGKLNALAGMSPTERRVKLLENHASFSKQMVRGLTRNPCYTCTRCGKYAVDIGQEGQREPAKVFKHCADCGVQMYCETGCQAR